MALVLAGAWQVLWSALARTNWQPARAAWRRWSQGEPLRSLPYTQAGSDAEKVSTDLGQFSAWLREWLWPRHGALLLLALAAGMVMLALGMAAGAPALLLTAAVVIIVQMAGVLNAGRGSPPAWSEGLIVIGLPFALGMLVLAPASWPLAGAVAVMGMALLGLLRGEWTLLHAGSALAIAACVLLRAPAAAFVMGVAWATGALLRPAGSRLALVALCLAGIALALMLQA
jgi:hypothetical protein